MAPCAHWRGLALSSACAGNHESRGASEASIFQLTLFRTIKKDGHELRGRQKSFSPSSATLGRNIP